MGEKRSRTPGLIQRITVAATMPDRSSRFMALDDLAAKISKSPRHVSLKAASEVVRWAHDQEDPGVVAAALWIAGTHYLRRFDHFEAGSVLSDAIARAAEAGDRQLQGRALEAAAETACKLHDYSRTLLYAGEALEVWEREADLTHQATSLTWVGAALLKMSRYQEAFEKLHASLELFNRLGKNNLAGRALNYVAILHQELGDFDEAFRLYSESLSIVRLQGDREMQGRVLSHIGETYVALNKNERAVTYLSQSAAILRPLGAHSLYAWCLLATARLHMNLGEDGRAHEVFKQALEAAQRGGAKRTMAEALTGFGSLCAKMGSYEEALKHLYRALAFAEEARIDRERYKINQALALVHEQFGNTEQAFKHYRQFHDIRAAVYDSLAKAKISSLTSEFELEKSRQLQEISHLRNVELARAYQELQELHVRLQQQTCVLQELSIRDDLTGVYNRRYLDQRLSEEFARACRYRGPLTVAMWDVDRFKDINDRLSHAIGDAVLRRLTDLVGEHIRECDILARYGGEEFVVVFLETGLSQAIVPSEKIRAAVEDFDWSAIHPDLHVTVSLGLSDDLSVNTWEEMLSNADARLYEAKMSGRNRICY